MIEPVRQGQELLEEIEQTAPPAGTVAVWWLGQSRSSCSSRRGRLAGDRPLPFRAPDREVCGNEPAPRSHDESRPDPGSRLARHRPGAGQPQAFRPFRPRRQLPELLASSPALLVLPEAIREHAGSARARQPAACGPRRRRQRGTRPAFGCERSHRRTKVSTPTERGVIFIWGS